MTLKCTVKKRELKIRKRNYYKQVFITHPPCVCVRCASQSSTFAAFFTFYFIHSSNSGNKSFVLHAHFAPHLRAKLGSSSSVLASCHVRSLARRRPPCHGPPFHLSYSAIIQQYNTIHHHLQRSTLPELPHVMCTCYQRSGVFALFFSFLARQVKQICAQKQQWYLPVFRYTQQLLKCPAGHKEALKEQAQSVKFA